MIRGTAQPFRFKIPCNFNELKSVTITFSQDNYYGLDITRSLPIVKTLDQCRQGGSPKELVVILNKEETFRFTDKRKAYVQMIAEATNGLPFGNKPEIITVYPVLNGDNNNENDDIIPTPDVDGIVILDGSTIL